MHCIMCSQKNIAITSLLTPLFFNCSLLYTHINFVKSENAVYGDHNALLKNKKKRNKMIKIFKSINTLNLNSYLIFFKFQKKKTYYSCIHNSRFILNIQ